MLTSAITQRILFNSAMPSNSTSSINAWEITPISSQPTNSKASCDTKNKENFTLGQDYI